MSKSTVHAKSGDVFEAGCEPIDVTSNNRPDTRWKYIDAHGHVHQWYVDGKPATHYNPQAKHATPTLVWVVDSIIYYEDGEPCEMGHYECADCRDWVSSPGTCADFNTVYIAGPRWYRINGESVSPEEFERRYKKAVEEAKR